VLDADEISRASLKKGGACYSDVVALFGSVILAQDGEIDRKKLASIIFTDEEKRRQLNAIVHPYVIETMFSRAEEALNKSGGIVVFEVPLLFESGIHEKMDRNILVTCGKNSACKNCCKGQHHAPSRARPHPRTNAGRGKASAGELYSGKTTEQSSS
jgi:dephospho-CoA kinase